MSPLRLMALCSGLALATGCFSDQGDLSLIDFDDDGQFAPADCNDGDPDINQNAPELCDGRDNDCDGEVDEIADVEGDRPVFYADIDGDGAGDASASIEACAAPANTVTNAHDCDDNDEAVNPGATETCNGVDDNCDGVIDEAGALGGALWFTDTDGDGHGDPGSAVTACLPPAGAVRLSDDCDDADADIHPAVDELCNGIDDDCDGTVDNGLPSARWYADTDADGWGTGAPTTRCDSPGAGFVARQGDCDDAASTTYPGAPEVCDGVDQDCDGQVDEGPATDGIEVYEDADGDGFGLVSTVLVRCEAPTGWVSEGTDCNDNNAEIHPGHAERCDDIDEDCDGVADNDPTDTITHYGDSDGDGFHGEANPVEGCTVPSGRSLVWNDCDDSAAAVNPDATEACNGRDDDCNGQIDEAGAAGETTFYADVDGDGFGISVGGVTEACERPTGFADAGTDCDDGDADVNPDATETCDGRDEDCNELIDDSAVDGKTWYPDDDRDGFGPDHTARTVCVGPQGWVLKKGDCDDRNADVNPDGTEVCNTLDDDCNGTVDDASAGFTWYADGDGDGWGADSPSKKACYTPVGFAPKTGDCDDDDATVHPEIGPYEEVPGDGIDQDCDGEDACRDLNCDGEPDLIVVAPSQPWRVRVYWAQRGGSRYSDSHMEELTRAEGVTSAAAGYFSDDEVPDVITSWAAGSLLDSHINDPSAEALEDAEALGPASAANRLLSADLDGDGYTDLITLGNSTDVHWGPWIGGTPDQTDTLSTSRANRAELAKLNSDDHLDLVVNQDEAVSVFFGSSAGFDPSDRVVLPQSTWRDAAAAFDVGDLDDDGHLDVVVTYHNHCCSGDTKVYWGAADGPAPGDFTAIHQPANALPFIVDQDGDGTTDLVMLTTQSNGIRIWPGGAGFDRAVYAAYDWPTIPSVVGAGLADFDGDGDLDLAWPSSAYTGGYYLEWDSDHFEKRIAIPGYRGGGHVADVDRDGYPDFLSAEWVYYGGPAGLNSRDHLGFNAFKQASVKFVVVGAE